MGEQEVGASPIQQRGAAALLQPLGTAPWQQTTPPAPRTLSDPIL